MSTAAAASVDQALMGDDGAPLREHHHAHHFPTARAEAEASKLGMWAFLVTEILLFGGLFCAYAVYHTTHHEMFKGAHKLLSVKMGGLNTVVLIFSSLTMALAVRAAQTNKPTRTIQYLLVTLACAATFLVVKYFEYSAKFEHGLLPGHYFHPHEPDLLKFQSPHIFFGIYFLMTGLHGLHVLIGMAAIIWVLVRTTRREFSSKYYTPVELVGLYWHLVDLIWIYLFPLLYLVG